MRNLAQPQKAGVVQYSLEELDAVDLDLQVGRPGITPARRGQSVKKTPAHGSLGQTILAWLEKAGPEGATIKELASKVHQADEEITRYLQQSKKVTKASSRHWKLILPRPGILAEQTARYRPGKTR